MDKIKHELAGYRLPTYVEEILTGNYCSGFMRMSMVRENENYSFNYKPGNYSRLCPEKLSLYEKLLLIRTLIDICEKSKEHMIRPESFLLEPELVYLKDNKVTEPNVKLMYYPDVKVLSFRYKIVLFAGRILDRNNKEERDVAEQIRLASESGDINRVRMYLDKSIMRLENRMLEAG